MMIKLFGMHSICNTLIADCIGLIVPFNTVSFRRTSFNEHKKLFSSNYHTLYYTMSRAFLHNKIKL